METGEIIAIVVVVLVLIVGASFLFYRCCKSILQVVEDDQKPARPTFMSSMKDGLRRSFRSSFRRVSGLRNSFRRSGPRRSGPNADKIRKHYEKPKPVVVVSTIQDLKKETSELHPAYMKKNLKNEGVSVESVRGLQPSVGPSTSHTNYPNPLYERDYDSQQSPYGREQHDKSSGYRGAKPAIKDKLRSGISGYKKMEEEDSPTHKASYSVNITKVQLEQGYNNDNYQAESPVRSPPRYDIPFEETPVASDTQATVHSSQGHLAKFPSHQYTSPPGSGQVASSPSDHSDRAQDGQKYFNFPEENVRFTNPEKRYMSVDTYI